jgi:hypothetical protein
MKSKLLGLIALAPLLGLFPSPANALNFDFSFTGSMNAAPFTGIVTGEIIGLTNGASTATDVIIDSYPSAFTNPSPLPFDTFCGSNCLVTSNSFTVTAGAITAYNFEVTSTTLTGLWSLVLGASEDSFSNGTGANQINLITQGTQSGTTFNPVGTTGATPLPAALPLFATGLGALGLLGWRRKRKAALAA